VVAGDTEVVESSQKFNAFVGVGTIANYIAEAPDLIEATAGFGILEDCLECGQVAVDIAKNGITHDHLNINYPGMFC
jgi:hypothetical protein